MTIRNVLLPVTIPILYSIGPSSSVQAQNWRLERFPQCLELLQVPGYIEPGLQEAHNERVRPSMHCCWRWWRCCFCWGADRGRPVSRWRLYLCTVGWKWFMEHKSFPCMYVPMVWEVNGFYFYQFCVHTYCISSFVCVCIIAYTAFKKPCWLQNPKKPLMIIIHRSSATVRSSSTVLQ